MKNDSELEINHDWSDDQDYSPKRRFMRSGNTGFLRILLAVLLILLFLAGIFYFLSRQSTDDETRPPAVKAGQSGTKDFLRLKNRSQSFRGKSARWVLTQSFFSSLTLLHRRWKH